MKDRFETKMRLNIARADDGYWGFYIDGLLYTEGSDDIVSALMELLVNNKRVAFTSGERHVGLADDCGLPCTWAKLMEINAD